MKRLLVTGASGLLGLNLIVQAAGRYEVSGVLRRERLSPDSIASFRPLLADLTEPGQAERLISQVEPDAVVHCAALTDVDYCQMHPAQAQRLNREVAREMAEITAREKVALLHISTDAVFDGVKGDYSEEDPPNPLNVYASTKLDGERAVAEANPDAIIARVNFFGWSWQGRRSLAEWFFNNLSAGNPIKGFTDLIFCPLLANDMAEILLRMLDLRLSGIFHVVSADSQSKFTFGKTLARQFGFDENLISPASYTSAGLRAPRARLLNLRSDKLARALGEDLPGQADSMRRFHQLFCKGYPRSLRSVFIPSDQTPVG